MRDDVVRVVEKHRIEVDGTGRGASHETWKEIDGNPEKVTETMADYLWHEFGIDVEEKGIEIEGDEE